MNILEINLFVLVQRAIELLAFYLILANLTGIDLKDSLVRLFKTKQRILYENWVLMVVYPVGITLILQLSREHAYLIDNIMRPFVACFLLKLSFNLRRTLLSYILTMGVAFIIGATAYVFLLSGTEIHGIFVFLCILILISFMVYRNYFENIYVRLLKNNWILNGICVLSFSIFLIDIFSNALPIILPIILSILLFGAAFIQLKRETTDIIKQIEEASISDVFQILRDISSEYAEHKGANQYIIKNHNTEIARPLEKALNFQKRRGAFRNFDFNVSEKQIKINVILK